MKIWKRITKNKILSFPAWLGGVFFVALVLFGLRMVFAGNDEKTIYVFPTKVTSVGWKNDSNASEQNLSGKSIFSDFDLINSAGVLKNADGGNHSNASSEKNSEELPSEQKGDVQTDEENDEKNIAPDTKKNETQNSVEPKNETNAPAESAAAEEKEPAKINDSDIGAEVLSFLKNFATPLFAEEMPAETKDAAEGSSEAKTGSGNASAEPADETDGEEAENIQEASTTATSKPEVPGESEDEKQNVDDQGTFVCEIKGKDCYTMELSGFGIADGASLGEIKKAALRLSFAAKGSGELSASDRLFVKYFYKGEWYLADSIALNKEISNASNGGHFLYTMPDITNWDELANVKVSIEFDRNSNENTEVFVDSAWLDIAFKTSEEIETAEKNSNVSSFLRAGEESNDPDILQVGPGKKILFTNGNEISSKGFTVKTDKNVYEGLSGQTVYFSVTNTTESEDKFDLGVYFPETGGEVKALRKWTRNVPYETTVSDYRPLTYFCEEGWMATTTESASDIAKYECASSFDIESCDTLNADKTNCTVNNSRIGSRTEAVYQNVWRDAVITQETGNNFLKNIQGIFTAWKSDEKLPYRAKQSFQGEHLVFSGQTIYFAMDISYPANSRGRFFIEAKHGDAFGLLSPKWQGGWKYRMPVEIAGATIDSEFYVVIDESLSDLWNSVNEDGSDLRFITDDGKELAYWLSDWDHKNKHAGMWVKYDKGSAQRSLYLYYGNKNATSASSSLAPFLHTDLSEMYRPANYENEAQNKGFSVVSLTDKNEIKLSGFDAVSLDRGEVAIFRSFNTSSILSAKGPVMAYAPDAEKNIWEPIAPPESDGEIFSRKEFASEFALPADASALRIVCSGEKEISVEVISQDMTIVENGSCVPSEGSGEIFLGEGDGPNFTAGSIIISSGGEKVPFLAFMKGSGAETPETFIPLFGAPQSRGSSPSSVAVTFGKEELSPVPQTIDDSWADLDMLDALKKRENKIPEEFKYPKINDLLDTKKDFNAKEDPAFRFKYKLQRNAIVQFARGLFTDKQYSVKAAYISHPMLGDVPVGFDVVYGENNEWTLKLKKDSLDIRPGKYTLKIEVDEGEKTFIDEMNFYWGVLAMNATKAEYLPGETVKIEMAALSQNGDTLCHANLSLAIVNPKGVAYDAPVAPSGLCDGNNVVNVPDYSAEYETAELGIYTAKLSLFDDNGDFTTGVTNTFEVKENIPFEITRTGPTRIYPPAPYTMSVSVKANKNFSGDIREKLPQGFTLTDSDATAMTTEDDGVSQVWNVDLKAGESVTLRYSFDAPDVSPYLYILPPLEFLHSGNASSSPNSIFKEARSWQIASDAVGQVIVLWDGGAAPAGWTCISCGSGDFFQKFFRGAASYLAAAGGAATHTPTASGAVADNTTGARNNNGGTNISSTAHHHTYTPVLGSASNLPSHRQLRVIRYDSAGEPATIPAGAILFFDATVPSGWTQYSAQDGYYVYGEDTVGTTGGSNTHTHTISGDTDAAYGGTVAANNNNPRGGAANPTHTHTVSGATAATNNEPAYVNVILGKLTNATTTQNGYITMWNNEPAEGWSSLSDVGGPFYQKFIKPSATYGTTGGSDTHATADVLGIVSGQASAAVTNRNNGGAANASTHTHSVNVTNFSTDENLPPYNDVIFAKRLAGIPKFTQEQYQWYVTDTANTPTDPWPSGDADLTEDTPITVNDAPPGNGSVLRLRMSLQSINSTTTASTQSFSLQYGAGEDCSAISSWTEVGGIGSSEIWRGYDNGSLSDGDSLSQTVLPLSASAQSYEEESDSAVNPVQIDKNTNGEWDFVLENNMAAPATHYCFRMAYPDDTALYTYNTYAELITNSAPAASTIYTPFDNETVSDTTPSFEFYSVDPEANDMHYQVQIDDNADFSSPVIDNTSTSTPANFNNLTIPADKAPYNNGNRIEFIPSVSLSNATTYWWRVRAIDPSGANTFASWTTAQSITVNTSATISTWFQTTYAQFATDSFSGTRASSTGNLIDLITPGTSGTATSTSIVFSSGSNSTATSWGTLSWSSTTPAGSTVKLRLWYYTSGEAWTLIPDSDIAGNSTGLTASAGVSLLSLDESTYGTLRIEALFTATGASAQILDWTISWGSRVATPVPDTLFNNEKVGTTTPTFMFSSSDPQGDDLEYQFQWASSPTFASPTTRNSSDASPSGFANVTSPGDTDPFSSEDNISFTIKTADALVNGNTYWWRVRAKDPLGGNAYSLWSDARSFTIDTSVTTSTWHQTTDDQFDTDTFSNTESSSNSAAVSSTAREAIAAYAEGAVQTPRYRVWNGTAWGAELSASSVGSTIKWVVLKESPKREEYVMATIGEDAAVKAQVYKNGAWGNMQTIANALSNTSARGVDVAYESNTGDAVVVACDGDPDPTYYKWNGTSWFESGAVNVATATNCNWIKMASDPVASSNEIIAMTRGTGLAYEAQVWSGSTWGNAATFGAMTETANEGMSVEYEESGGQAIALSSNTGTSGFLWRSWNGTAWSPIPGAAATARSFPNGGGDDFEWGTLKRDAGTDNMALCYIDHDVDIGTVFWDGSAFGTNTELTGAGNAKTGRPIDCEYETSTGRDGYLMAAYSDTSNAIQNYWTGAAWAGGAALSTIQDSFTGQMRRTGDGLLLSLWFDDVNGRYDFSSWNGTAWSSPLQSLETVPSVTVSPFGEPFMIAAANESLTGRLTSSAISFTDGDGPFWNTATTSQTTPAGSSLLYQIEYYNSGTGSWTLIPNSDLADNDVGTSTLPINIRPLDKTTYGQIRMVANFTCASAGNCPSIQDWTITWAAGITISGTIKQYDETTNVTSGMVAVAKNGILQTGKTGTISGTGTWTIQNVNAAEGDVITVFVSGANDSNEAVGIAKYDGTLDMEGMSMFERHLSIGSDDNQIITNADISAYDNSVSSNEDIFNDVDAGNDLVVCYVITGCTDAKLYVKIGNTYRPDSENSGNVTTHDMVIKGSLNADANTIYVYGSWTNSGSFTSGTGSVIMRAASGTETINSTDATSYDFYNLTLGQSSGTAVWSLGSALVVTNDLSVTYGTLDQNGGNAIDIRGNLSIGANGGWTKGTANVTFSGSGTKTWSDSTASKQDIGIVVVDGTSKTVQFGTNVKATNITIGSDDVLDANSGNFSIEVTGNWENNNAFVPRTGTVTFSTTTAGHTIATGASSFYKVTFQGVGGAWQFTAANATTTNDLTITSGTVTLPSNSLAVGGSYLNNGGAFDNSSATLRMTSTSAGKSVKGGGSDFYNLIFNGTGGSWTMTDTNATTTNDLTISAGGVTLPSGVLAVGGSFIRPGGTFTHNSGTVKMTAMSGGKSVTPGTSSFNNLTFDGTGGWTITTASPTILGNYTIEDGAVTNPTGTLSVAGSYIVSGGTFAHSNGTVLMNAGTTGKTVDPGSSPFYTLTLNNALGGWTVSANATTTNNFNLTAADTFVQTSGTTFEVDGTFTNIVGDVPTTWTGSTLYLNSGTTYSMNAKTSGSDVYSTLKIGANTKVSGWNTSANAVYSVDPSGYLYLQDHGSVDGDLYIWGNYSRNSGSEYWDYAKDFDGTALGAGSRSVDVRFASGASALFSGGTLEMLGSATASTTIDNQGSGNYSISITGGTLNAQYYQFRNTDVNGLNILGTTTITSLDDGDFELSIDDGSMITVASTTISFAANNLKQIWRVRFATTTPIGGNNVTETGTATSNWWFRNSYGNVSGESFDVDPGGNPGYIKWDDSGYEVTVGGTVFTGEEVSPALSTCATPNVVKIVVEGGSSYTGNCSEIDGTYSIPNVAFTGDVSLIVYLNTGGGSRGATITKTPTGNLSGINIYENRVIVRHENTEGMTIADMAFYDSSDDADIPFTATVGPSALVVAPETELHIWDNKTFVPGGNITLQSGGSGNIYDGRLHIGNSSIFTATGSESHSIGGNFQKDAGSTFTAANSTFTFTATTTGKSIIGVAAPAFWDLTFDGTGGGWSLDGPVTVSNTLTPTAGTISGTGSLTVSGANVSGNAIFNMTGGTVTLNAGGNFGGANNWQFYDLTFGNGSTVATTTKTGANTVMVTDKITIAASHGLDAGDDLWTITGAGTSFVKTGYFEAGT
ncbi:MAG: DUF2341 domain-containing protein, partial [Candidatus Pacebacteria bacterium]|nr:DUF2341 domain-containing protein [Candidatus Paceibacterota bacterium]